MGAEATEPTLPAWIADALRVEQVLATFAEQDSGNLSFGVQTRRDRWFVKLATTDEALEGLVRAAQLHRQVQHPAIVPLHEVLRSVGGTALVHPWVDGRNLYAPATKRRKKRSAPGRFRQLQVDQILRALQSLFDAHLAISAAGFVSSDFYDGNLIYDFDRQQLHLIDLDEYRPGPFALDAERAKGSARFVAPEERRRGATIDERTTVYHLARAASILLDEGDNTGVFRGSAELHQLALAAQDPDPDGRPQTVSEFAARWTSAQDG